MCTATVAEMTKLLTDLESKMGPSHPASVLLRTALEEAKKARDGVKPSLEKIQSAEKRLRTHQKAVKGASTKRDQLQLSLQIAQDKLHEALTQRREQLAEITDLRSHMTVDLPQVSPRQCPLKRGVRRSWGRRMYSQEATLSNSRSPCARRLQRSDSRSHGHGDGRRRCAEEKERHARWLTLQIRVRGCVTEEVKLTAQEKLLLREACKKTKVERPHMAVRSGERHECDCRRGSRKHPLTWFSFKSTDGRHRSYLSTSHELASPFLGTSG